MLRSSLDLSICLCLLLLSSITTFNLVTLVFCDDQVVPVLDLYDLIDGFFLITLGMFLFQFYPGAVDIDARLEALWALAGPVDAGLTHVVAASGKGLQCWETNH